MQRCLFCFILLMLPMTVLSAPNQILDSYEVVPGGKDSELVINFTEPVSYQSHFPEAKSRVVEIKIRPLRKTINDFAGQGISESLDTSVAASDTIFDIHYEQDVVNFGVLTIQFAKVTEYKVELARDKRSMTIKMKNVSVGKRRSKSIELPIYVINLKSSTKRTDVESQDVLALFKEKGYDVFIDEQSDGKQTIYSLRLGYFHSKKLAEANMNRLKPYYSLAWLDQVKSSRRQLAKNWFINRGQVAIKNETEKVATEQKIDVIEEKKQAPGTKTAKGPEPAHKNKLDVYMEKGRQAMIDKDYRSAIKYFTKVIRESKTDTDYHRNAQELLGLSRERNGQLALAKAEYSAYLKLYPEGKDSDRVRQRLNGILTARSKDKEKLARGDKRNTGAEPEWEYFGSFSQFYRRQENSIGSSPSTVTDNSLNTDFVLSARKRDKKWSQRVELVANHRFDFNADTDANDGHIYSLYYDMTKKNDSFSMRIGRQTHSSDGVLGRFDGIILKSRVASKQKINFIYGHPVELNLRDGVNSNRSFYAISYDFESLAKNLDLKIFYINQKNHELTDRQAIGTEWNYVDDEQSYFLTIDYDTYYGELNQATFVGTWRYKDQTSLSVVADLRNSPLLTTNNALIGQSVTDLEQLRALFTDSEIEQLAQDRTAKFRNLTISMTTPLSKRYQLNGDITFSKLDATVASGGVPANPATDTEAFYNVQMVANGFFSEKDVTILGIRHSAATTSDTNNLNFSTRFNLNKKWRLNPRLVYEVRDNTNGSTRKTFKPRLIASYRSTRSWKYELDVGLESAETETATGTTKEDSKYIFFGYIHDF